MSKIQHLKNVAGEADTLCQALTEFFNDYIQSFREDEQDENAESLLEQVRALGQNARAAYNAADEEIENEDHQKIPIEVSSQRQERNSWVDAGLWHTAMFLHPHPEGIKGCPCGRSQESVDHAIRDLLDRTNGESGTCLGMSSVVLVLATIGEARWKKNDIGWRCQTCHTLIGAAWPFKCDCPELTPAT